MKRIILFCSIVCIAISGYARHDVVYLCQGSTYSWNLSGYCTTNDTLVYASGPNDWTIFYDNIQYDTIVGNVIQVSPSQDRLYEVISINGNAIVGCPIYLTVYVKNPPTISIPSSSIHHVTCPDGYLYPYADGSFHVSLHDSVQNYTWIDISNNSVFFSAQTYDSVTVNGLRSGIYHVIAHGTNGCAYHDSVIIVQPEPWDWDNENMSIDTLRCGMETGCIVLAYHGGTPPLHYQWFYYDEQGDTIYFSSDTNAVCGLPVGCYYNITYDSRGCKLFGDEVSFMYTVIYELVTDTIHMESVDTTICPGQEIMLSAYSRGYGNHTWIVGNYQDSVNYYTGVDPELGYISMYFIDSLAESQYVTVTFVDENGCETRDSIWVEVYNSNISLTIETPSVVTDSMCTVSVSPPGGNLFVDGVVVGYDIPSNYTFSTAGISVGEHTLRYAGIFGAEMGVGCDDEISIPIQVETNPFVQDWEYEISIYPNPTTTVLNLSSTGTSDFELSIVDITGKVIKSEKMLEQTFTFDVSDLASGMYMLRLVSHDGASKIVKFVKRLQ